MSYTLSGLRDESISDGQGNLLQAIDHMSIERCMKHMRNPCGRAGEAETVLFRGNIADDVVTRLGVIQALD